MSVPSLGMKVRVLLCALEYGSQRPSQLGQEAGREQLEVRSRHPVEGDAAPHEMTPRRDPMRFGVVTHENVGRPRIPVEPVRRGEGVIVIDESTALRRLTFSRCWSRHHREF